MLDTAIRKKLESITTLPSIPFIMSEVLNAVDNSQLSASQLASIIERDQTLTARVLAVANSPFYGFSRRISTIDLAVVVLGLNAIKEIVISLLLQKFFSGISRDYFDVNSFWYYSVFCGAASRYLARRFEYRLAGEAFVGGLMHDIGILIMIQYFGKKFTKIREIQTIRNFSFYHSEQIAMKTSHCDIGRWFAERWNLPKQLCDSISNHHTPIDEVIEDNLENNNNSTNQNKLPNERIITNYNPSLINYNQNHNFQPLTLIVAVSEWFAYKMGFKEWALEKHQSPLYINDEIISGLLEHEILDSQSHFELIKQEILEEYKKASILIDLQNRPLN